MKSGPFTFEKNNGKLHPSRQHHVEAPPLGPHLRFKGTKGENHEMQKLTQMLVISIHLEKLV